MGWVTSETCAPPANDGFAGQVLQRVVGQRVRHQHRRYQAGGRAQPRGNAGGPSIWYSWTAPSTATYTFRTAGSTSAVNDLDTLLGLYTGASVGALTLVANNDDVSGTERTSRIGPRLLTGGVTYRIAVDGYRGAGLPAVTGLVKLTWSARPATADFDGNRSSERSVFRGGQWYADGLAPAFFGLPGDVPVPANYDGDGDVDRAVYRNGA